MSEYDKMARGTFVSTGNAQFVNLPFQPTSIQMWNYSSFATPAQHGVPQAYWDASMGQGFATEFVFNATPALTTDVVTSNGFSTFAGGTLLQYGPQIQIASIAKANPTIVTTASAHGLTVGQVVILEGLFQTSTTGMPQISLMPFVITAVGSPTTFTILWNSNQSNYTALSGSPSGAFVRQVLYPFLYEPGQNFISAITTGTTTTVTTTNNHNYVVGQQIGFRIPTAYGTTQLNELPNGTIPGSPVYYYVTSITSNTVFVCNANSTGATAFATNQTVASMVGQSLPQVVAVGDVNSGGNAYSGGNLYPSPSFPTFSGGVPTINGPAIAGAFVNNTSQGFVIGAGAGTNDASSSLVGANGNVIYWKATYG
jgi:hypothetical protein